MSLTLSKPSNFKTRVAPAEKKDVDNAKARAIADRIHEAVDGWGTDEDAIFAALEEAAQSPGMMDAVKAQYSSLFGETMQRALDDDMSGDDLRRANNSIRGAKGAETVATNSLVDDPNMYAEKITAEIQSLNGYKAALADPNTPPEVKQAIIDAFGGAGEIQATIDTLSSYRTALQTDPDSIDVEAEHMELMTAISTAENAILDFEPIIARLDTTGAVAGRTPANAGGAGAAGGFNTPGRAAAQPRDIAGLQQELGADGEMSYADRYTLLSAMMDREGYLQRLDAGDPELLQQLSEDEGLMFYVKQLAQRRDALLSAYGELQDMHAGQLKKNAENWG